MNKDYYKTLGLDKSASKEDVKKAFRKVAHQYHPDKNKGDKAAEQKFKEASEAYSVLSDDQKRKQYDMFGAAGVGGTSSGSYGGFNPGAGFGSGGFGGFDFSQFTGNNGFHFSTGGEGVEFDLGDIFGEFFGMGGRGRRRSRRGMNISVDLNISFKESIFGAEKEISFEHTGPDGKTKREELSIKVPPGIESGQGLRVPGKGEPSPEGDNPGDLIVRIWVEKHPHIRKEGFNLVMELDLRLTLALSGGILEIETLDGKVELKIPAGTSHGEILRLKSKGVPYTSRGLTGAREKRGDLLIVTRVKMPRKLSKNAQRLIEELKNEGL